jgi:hypothetical protein
MGCLFILVTMLSPRLGIIILWAFTNYVNVVFNTWLWPLLGIVFLPWTTLIYILVAAPVGGITFWGWLMVGLGLISDLTAHAQAYTNRQQAMSLYQQPAA